MDDHLLAPHLEVFYPCFEYTEILDLQLPHVHLTANVTEKITVKFEQRLLLEYHKMNINYGKKLSITS